MESLGRAMPMCASPPPRRRAAPPSQKPHRPEATQRGGRPLRRFFPTPHHKSAARSSCLPTRLRIALVVNFKAPWWFWTSRLGLYRHVGKVVFHVTSPAGPAMAPRRNGDLKKSASDSVLGPVERVGGPESGWPPWAPIPPLSCRRRENNRQKSPLRLARRFGKCRS